MLITPGGGGVPRISSDRDIPMGAKINTQKIPWASNITPKNPWTKIRQRIPCRIPEVIKIFRKQ